MSNSTEPSSWFSLTVNALDQKAVDKRNGYAVLVLPEDGTRGANAATSVTQDKAKPEPRKFISWEFGGGVGCY